ncbi:MAG: hypothetical protein OXH59_19270 [Rhodospirillaceae bacterium]|nr:hypothetical protein [Rhodospirillaceae bacterium]
MARRVGTWDAVRAWRYIRTSREYRDGYARRGRLPGLPERAPFPLRLRTAADIGAMRWGMLAWEDPYETLPLAPFWADAGVIAGRLTGDSPSLVRMAAEGRATVSGLRLGDGGLMLRIEQGDDRAVLVRLPPGAAPDEGSGLMVGRDLARIEDIWQGVPAPRPGRARRGTSTSFCWRSKGTRGGFPGAASRRACGTRSGSRRNTPPTAG